MTVQLELELPQEKIDLLNELARERKQAVSDMLAAAIADWLDEEAKRQRARQVLREFGKGLGHSEPPHDAARHHDKYLYGKL